MQRVVSSFKFFQRVSAFQALKTSYEDHERSNCASGSGAPVSHLRAQQRALIAYQAKFIAAAVRIYIYIYTPGGGHLEVLESQARVLAAARYTLLGCSCSGPEGAHLAAEIH